MIMESSTSTVYSQKGSDVLRSPIKKKVECPVCLVNVNINNPATLVGSLASRMTAAKEDVQVQMNDAFSVMQRAAKGKAKAITQPPEQVTVTELPWYLLGLLAHVDAH